MMRKRAILATLCAILAGCKEQPKPAVEITTPPKTEVSVSTSEPGCMFTTAGELQTYLKQQIQQQLPKIIPTYNKTLHMNVQPQNITINYILWTEKKQTLPDFHYDYDERRLVLEYAPKQDTNSFVQNLCAKRNDWEFYQTITTGFTAHEVGHWYHDRLLRMNGMKIPSDDGNRMKFVGGGIVIEGIAVYLSTLINPKESLQQNQDYAPSFDNVATDKLYKRWVYPAGERLVRPILEQDAVKGILLMNSTTLIPSTARRIEQYQNEILARTKTIKK